jgi:hypothetical protein
MRSCCEVFNVINPMMHSKFNFNAWFKIYFLNSKNIACGSSFLLSLSRCMQRILSLFRCMQRILSLFTCMQRKKERLSRLLVVVTNFFSVAITTHYCTPLGHVSLILLSRTDWFLIEARNAPIDSPDGRPFVLLWRIPRVPNGQGWRVLYHLLLIACNAK